ncbi:MAG: Ig domain-containing protein, partial [Bacteroidales bacterium]|nr:Ig domain-containing protein [Bacteroidales bacterium]
MKRIVLLMIGCALLACGCAKDLASVEEPVVPGHLTIDIVPSIDVPQTRDVKTGWEKGDKIYVFFDIKKGVTSFDYITMTYNGSKWLFSFSSDTLEETLLSGSGGYVTALYFPYGTPTFTLSKKTSTTSRLSFKFSFDPGSGGDYGIAYYCCPKADYTVADGHLMASLYMSLLPGDVQFFIPDIPAENVADFTFQCDQIKKRQVGTLGFCLDFKWTTTEPEVTFTSKAGSAYAFKGYPYKGGMVFVGNLSSPGTSQDYEITVTDTKGTSDSRDDVPYIFKVSGKTLNAHDAVRLPALTSSRWKKLVFGHDYVDFGLPSGNLWATENLLASKPNYLQGGAFAWAATEEEEEYNFSWSTYPWIKSGYSSPYYITKYTFRDGEYDGIWYNSNHQFIGDDYKTLAHCNYEDDAARYLWGSPWHIPSPEAFQELVDNTNNYWVDDYEGYGGYMFVSKKDANKFIFMPVTGIWSEYGELTDKDWSGNYWTSSLYTDPYSADEPESSMAAKYFYFNGGNQTCIDYASRCYGCAVRPVIGAEELTVSVTGVSLNKTTLTLNEGDTYQLIATVRPSNASNKEVMWDSSSNAVWVDNQGSVYAAKGGSATITVTTFDGKFTATCKVTVKPKPAINGHDYVDLGLPSGLKWATCNIGADSAKEYGDYFAWAETEPKEDYSWATYKWMQSGQSDWQYITKYTFADGLTPGIWYNSNNQFIGDGYKTLAHCNYADDAARQQWGGTWRVPSNNDFYELISNTTVVWMDDYLGVAGMLFASKVNNNAIFLPASGYRDGTFLYNAGSSGCYWSSSLYEIESFRARTGYFS